MKKLCYFILIVLFLQTPLIVFADNDFSDIKKQITVLYNTNKIKEAYQLISKIPEDNRDGEIWFLAANITQDYGHNSDAVYLLKKAISVEPFNYKYYYNLANIHLNDKKYNSAIANYKLCLKYNKEFSHAWNNLGLAYLGLNEYSKAKSAFMKAISCNNSYADFYYNLAVTYKKMDNKKQAEKILKIYNTLTNQD